MVFRVRLEIKLFGQLELKCILSFAFFFWYMSLCFGFKKCQWPCFPSPKLRVELYGRTVIRSSKRISNPGCYATSSQLLIAPLVNHIKSGMSPTVFGISGYSGAGSIISKDASGRAVALPKIAGESLGGGVKPYALTGHIHEREAGYHLSRLLTTTTTGGGDESAATIKVAFIPSVAPWFSGIISTVSIPLSDKLTAKDVIKMFEEKYGGERLVKIGKEVPELKDVKENHGWVVGGFQMSVEGDRVVIVGGLDNLLKGAATQCLQNLNLALGYDEFAGIPID